MAEGKNTIVVYKDWINIFDSLQPIEAGLLIQHLFRYVNDQNPEPPDRLTQLMFEPIKSALKRDLISWEAKKLRRSEAGSIGGKRSAEAKASKSKQKQASSTIASKSQANQAVSVTDSVSVSVNNTNTCPPESEFLEYCKSLLQDKYLPLEFSLKAKYKSWVDNNWKDGNNKQIKNWKTKISNVVPFLKPMQITSEQNPTLKTW